MVEKFSSAIEMEIPVKAGGKQISLNEVYHLFNDLPMEIAMFDVNGRYKFVNKQYEPDEKIRREMIGQDDKYYFDLKGIDSDLANRRLDYFNQVINDKNSVKFSENLATRHKKETRYYERNFKPVFSNGNREDISYVFLFGNDLSDVIHGQKEVEYLAHHDKLTGLRNRSVFHEQLKLIEQDLAEKENPGKAAVMIIDLNNFKLVNDAQGHQAGDLVIQEVASRISICIDDNSQVFRIGGDDFAIVIRNIVHEYDVSRIAEKITKYLAKPFLVKNMKINFLTASIGIVLIPRDGNDEVSVIRNAESALLNAKQAGKTTFRFFSKSMNKYSSKRFNIEKNLTEMVNKNEFDQQLKIHYQPIVEKISHGQYQIVGSEALLRWNNPELGQVSPARFIPIAEETNLINEIGEWILYRALREYKVLQEQVDDSVYLSVNFSAKQLRDQDTIRKLDYLLYKTRFNPKQLQLELTETSYLDDQGEVSQNLREIEQMGVKLALDDFGVGFASLSYLHKVPAKTIKIDRSFIQHISTSPRHNELVKSIILLGQNLEKDVVAEGIEQVADLFLLDAQKCYKYQGYLFSQPIELAGLASMLKKKKVLSTMIS